jgi:C-terminal processing protease CtpA/Prc
MIQRRIPVIALAVLALAMQVCSCPELPVIPTLAPGEPPTPEVEVDLAALPATGEPVVVFGAIPYTSPFFLQGLKDSFVLLEDQAGFVRRDREFEFPPLGQALGPIEIAEDDTLTYSLLLPAIPQGTFVDVDNDGEDETGVQVFAAAYWPNVWGDPFLERRDGTGWSTAYASTITDPERDDEIKGGTLIVWAPDDEQSFPTGFGEDDLLFTADDPIGPIEAGYNIIDLNQEPFEIDKEGQVQVDLIEGEVAVNDYSDLSYEEAFDAMFEKASREYPFTEDKGIYWDALYDEFAPRVADARNAEDFYRAILDFTWAIPDGHIGGVFNRDVFFAEQGGSFGMILAELSDGRVIVTDVLPNLPAAAAGLEVGAEIIEWDGKPVGQAIDQVQPYFGPFSTEHRKHVEQVVFLTRVPPGERVSVTFQNPDVSQPEEITMVAELEIDSLLLALPYLAADEFALPVQGEVLDAPGLGYIEVTTFAADYKLTTGLWEHYIDQMIENGIPGLIIDLRLNSGGSGNLAFDFASYFFDEEVTLSQRLYFNDLTETFEPEGIPDRIIPGPALYEGPIAVLVGPYCVSACEGFANALAHGGRSIVVGHFPSAGAYGEVGRGQYELPEELSLQFPTGRPETPDGKLLIEGVGVVPDITVPVTEESALGLEDAMLDAAIEALLEEIP